MIRSSRSGARRTAQAAGLAILPVLAGFALSGAGAATSPAADAAVASGAAAPCVVPAQRSKNSRAVRLHADHDRLSAKTLRAVSTQLRATKRAKVGQSLARGPFKGTGVKRELPATVNVPLFVHVISGKRAGEHNVTRKRVRTQVKILNDGYHGVESASSARTRYTFVLKRISFTTNESWYHASPMSAADQAEKRRLHVGDKDTLNLYISSPSGSSGAILGFSRFPWQQAEAPRLDGVTINKAGMLGGSARGYNRGDSAVHEVGHWLGLLHTFQGPDDRTSGCYGDGDGVADTPAEAGPSFACDTTSDTCSAPGLDPVHNFMDYSLDTCMNMFTAGQAVRMDEAYQRWRQR